MRAMDGMILCDKPAGCSSHDEVLRVRRALAGAKTGHAGTLDPFATGLLIVLVGRATRIARFLLTLPKTYVTVGRFGALSSTGDPDGEIVETGRIPPDPPPMPTGEVRQRPPVYSAIRIAGVRAYERARRGEEFEVPERTVHVHRFEQLWRDDGVRGAYEIECSSGTYVRSLIAELGDAYCESLRRTWIGPWGVDVADGETLIPLGDVLAAFLPVVQLDGEQACRARHGALVDVDVEGAVVLTDGDGPICIAEPREGGGAKASVGFRA
jgi:tRNA pseudouridine55 synthase